MSVFSVQYRRRGALDNKIKTCYVPVTPRRGCILQPLLSGGNLCRNFEFAFNSVNSNLFYATPSYPLLYFSGTVACCSNTISLIIVINATGAAAAFIHSLFISLRADCPHVDARCVACECFHITFEVCATISCLQSFKWCQKSL